MALGGTTIKQDKKKSYKYSHKLICIIVVRYGVNNMISYEFFRHQDFSDILFCFCLSASLDPD